jgi:predicted RNA-binding protein with PIN domain
MTASYLIDGYNLLYALGLVHARMKVHGLERARERLLGLLHAAHEAEAGAVTVVFDAGHAPAGAESEQDYRGLHVRFAVGHDQADDLIELLIRQASVPRQLYVVSDDHRIQRAARRRHCHVLACGEYLEELDRRQRQRPPAPEAPEKGGAISEGETRRWLDEFADLAADPEMKELNPFDFDDAS